MKDKQITATKQDRSNEIATKQISAYSLIDFCIELQKAYKEGYELDLETNEYVPITIGTLMVCTLVKQEEVPLEELKEASQEEVNDVVPEVVKPSGKRSKAV